MPDNQHLLIRGCIAGKRASQGKLYDLYCPRMIIVCMRYSKNREEAEEIMQEGFYRVFKYLPQFKNSGSLEGWIRKIMVNAAVQRYQPRSQLQAVVSIEHYNTGTDAGSDIYSIMQVKDLIRMVQSLPAACRMVFNLYVFEGYKHREIAEILDISEGTSKSHLHDARTILK